MQKKRLLSNRKLKEKREIGGPDAIQQLKDKVLMRLNIFKLPSWKFFCLWSSGCVIKGLLIEQLILPVLLK